MKGLIKRVFGDTKNAAEQQNEQEKEQEKELRVLSQPEQLLLDGVLKLIREEPQRFTVFTDGYFYLVQNRSKTITINSDGTINGPVYVTPLDMETRTELRLFVKKVIEENTIKKVKKALKDD